jgi:hypothetical protein
MESRRSHGRVPVSLDAAIEESGREIFAPIVNLSASGVLLASNEPPEVGAAVRIVMSLPPTGRFVRLHGQVVRHERTDRRSAFAVAFHAVDEGNRSFLVGFVSEAAEA